METSQPNTTSRGGPARKQDEVLGSKSPEDEMGAEDESASDASQSKDKKGPASKTRRTGSPPASTK